MDEGDVMDEGDMMDGGEFGDDRRAGAPWGGGPQGPWQQGPGPQGPWQQGPGPQGPWQQGPGPQGGWQPGPWQQAPQIPWQQGQASSGPWPHGPGGAAPRGALTPAVLPKVALGVCGFGLIGLLLPFVTTPIGFSATLFSLSPGLAVLLLLLFLGITALPVLDVRQGGLRWTPWLVIPGGVGVLAGLLVFSVFSGAGSSDSLEGLAIASGFVSLGSGAIMMVLASVGLAAVGVYGFVLESRRRSPHGYVGPDGWVPGAR